LSTGFSTASRDARGQCSGAGACRRNHAHHAAPTPAGLAHLSKLRGKIQATLKEADSAPRLEFCGGTSQTPAHTLALRLAIACSPCPLPSPTDGNCAANLTVRRWLGIGGMWRPVEMQHLKRAWRWARRCRRRLVPAPSCRPPHCPCFGCWPRMNTIPPRNHSCPQLTPHLVRGGSAPLPQLRPSLPPPQQTRHQPRLVSIWGSRALQLISVGVYVWVGWFSGKNAAQNQWKNQTNNARTSVFHSLFRGPRPCAPRRPATAPKCGAAAAAGRQGGPRLLPGAAPKELQPPRIIFLHSARSRASGQATACRLPPALPRSCFPRSTLPREKKGRE
jgi:hypothetical protein